MPWRISVSAVAWAVVMRCIGGLLPFGLAGSGILFNTLNKSVPGLEASSVLASLVWGPPAWHVRRAATRGGKGKMRHLRLALAGLAGMALGAAGSLPARAQDVHVGVVISQTGPAASLGIPQTKSIA